MAYRCEGCGHFAGLDEEPEFDEDSSSYDGQMFEASISASYTTTCCSQEAATAQYDVSYAHEFVHDEACDDPEPEYDISLEFSATDRFQEKDRHGKPIKSYRYRRHYYGVEVAATLKCASCGTEETIQANDESGPPEAL